MIESYKKDGTPVRMPVWFIENNGTLYVQSDRDTGMAKRIRRNPTMRIAPCNARGVPKKGWVKAAAVFATVAEAENAYQLLKKKYGIQYRAVRFLGRLQGRKSKAVALAIKVAV